MLKNLYLQCPDSWAKNKKNENKSSKSEKSEKVKKDIKKSKSEKVKHPILDYKAGKDQKWPVLSTFCSFVQHLSGKSSMN